MIGTLSVRLECSLIPAGFHQLRIGFVNNADQPFDQIITLFADVSGFNKHIGISIIVNVKFYPTVFFIEVAARLITGNTVPFIKFCKSRGGKIKLFFSAFVKIDVNFYFGNIVATAVCQLYSVFINIGVFNVILIHATDIFRLVIRHGTYLPSFSANMIICNQTSVWSDCGRVNLCPLSQEMESS